MTVKLENRTANNPWVFEVTNPNLPEELRDFRNFLWLAWAHQSLPDPTEVQFDMGDYLQNGPADAIIQAQRGEGKSWVTSAFVCWVLLLNPHLKILVVSASKIRADDFTTFTLQLISEMEILQHLHPTPDQRCSRVSFDVAPCRADHAPSVKSVGILGQLSGSRADLIIADDIETSTNSLTQGMREKLSEASKEFTAIIKKGGAIKMLGTPQTEQSIYNELQTRGYAIRIWTGRYPTPDKIKDYEGRLAPIILEHLARDPSLGEPMWGILGDMGAPTDPHMFGEHELLRKELDHGKMGFALQFMLDTTLSDAQRYPLRLSDLLVMDLDPKVAPERLVWARDRELEVSADTVGFRGDRFYKPMNFREFGGDTKLVDYTGSVLAIDPSGRGKDETTACVIKMLHGNLFLMDLGAWREGHETATLKAIAKMAKKYDVNAVRIEDNFGDGMFTKLLLPHLIAAGAAATVDEIKHTSNKEKRIIGTLEPVMTMHKLVVNRHLLDWDLQTIPGVGAERQRLYQLFYQLTRMTAEKGALAQDDRVDVLAIGVHYWTEQMDQDQEKKVQEADDEYWEKEEERFRDSATAITLYDTPQNEPDFEDDCGFLI